MLAIVLEALAPNTMNTPLTVPPVVMIGNDNAADRLMLPADAADHAHILRGVVYSGKLLPLPASFQPFVPLICAAVSAADNADRRPRGPLARLRS